MELRAVLELLRALERDVPLKIQCDSAYVIGIFTSWLAAWKVKGIVQKKLNHDIILTIDAELDGRDVVWEKVKGHSGHMLNELADALACSQSESARNEIGRTR